MVGVGGVREWGDVERLELMVLCPGDVQFQDGPDSTLIQIWIRVGLGESRFRARIRTFRPSK